MLPRQNATNTIHSKSNSFHGIFTPPLKKNKKLNPRISELYYDNSVWWAIKALSKSCCCFPFSVTAFLSWKWVDAQVSQIWNILIRVTAEALGGVHLRRMNYRRARGLDQGRAVNLTPGRFIIVFGERCKILFAKLCVHLCVSQTDWRPSVCTLSLSVFCRS